jgi:hypothetical protein
MQNKEEKMKRIEYNTLLSAGILLLALLLMAGTASAATVGNTIIVNGTQEYAPLRTGETYNTSIGGNITQIDVYTSTNQTQNWQGFWGNVSADIFLNGTNGQSMFKWLIDLNNTYVYAKTNDTLPNFNGFDYINITNVDRNWFSNKPMSDNVTNTYLNATSDVGRNDTIFVNNVVNTNRVNTSAGFVDYVIQDVPYDTVLANKNQTIWAATIYNPKKPNFKQIESSYELLVPVNMTATPGGERYWFYIEIP